MKALYLKKHFSTVDQIQMEIAEIPVPPIKKDHCLIKVRSSGVNPSDALGTLGYFSHAKLPRIPGRDFAGEIVEGPSSLMGKKVWGTGGAVGLDENGCHAEFLLLPLTAIAEIPHNQSIDTAGAQVLPYVTAYYSLVRRARIQKGEKILIIGGLGQVGRAALSICKWKGCHPIALVRKTEDIEKANQLGWETTSEFTGQFDVILNTIGNSAWEQQLSLLNSYGRLVVIAAPEGKREATFNLFDFYRANQEFCGINTVSLDFTQNACLLKELKEGFESGALSPLPIDESMIFSLDQATHAYQTVLKKSHGKRIVLQIS